MIILFLYFPKSLVFESQVNADGRHNVPVFHSTALPNNLKAPSPTHAVTGLALQANNKPTKCKCMN